MSAPALRRPARMRPVLMERLERHRNAYCWAAGGLVVAAVWLRLEHDWISYHAALACVLLAGYSLASPHNGQPVWDAAMPVDPSRHALVRLLCGVAGAAFLLAILVGLYTALFGAPQAPGWYPLAFFAWGLTCHLLTSAAALHHRDGFSAALLTLPWPSVALIVKEPAEFRQMGVLEVLTWTALPLALAAAAAYTATRFPARAPQPVGGAPRRERALAAPSAPTHPRPVDGLRPQNAAHFAAMERAPARVLPIRRRGPHRRPDTWTVFRQHFVLLRRFVIVPVVTVAFAALTVMMEPVIDLNQAGEGPTLSSLVQDTGLGELCVWLALSWMVLVWVAERDGRRRWNDALPVGTTRRRILHAAAGAAWLLLFLAVVIAAPVAHALAAGMLSSPSDVPAWLWFGLPCRTVALYLAATLVFSGAGPALDAWITVGPKVLAYVSGTLPRRLQLVMVLVVFAWVGVVPYGLFMLGAGLIQNPAGALAGDAGPNGWSHLASAFWLMLYAPAAAGAIALNEWIRRLDRLPTLQEMRRVLHGWAGTESGPPLRGAARQ